MAESRRVTCELELPTGHMQGDHFSLPGGLEIFKKAPSPSWFGGTIWSPQPISYRSVMAPGGAELSLWPRICARQMAMLSQAITPAPGGMYSCNPHLTINKKGSLSSSLAECGSLAGGMGKSGIQTQMCLNLQLMHLRLPFGVEDGCLQDLWDPQETSGCFP